MKYTIIACDLCGGRIYNADYLHPGEGALNIRARQLEYIERHMGHGIYRLYPEWKRQKYHICPKCVAKIKEYCSEGAKDATD